MYCKYRVWYMNIHATCRTIICDCRIMSTKHIVYIHPQKRRFILAWQIWDAKGPGLQEDLRIFFWSKVLFACDTRSVSWRLMCIPLKNSQQNQEKGQPLCANRDGWPQIDALSLLRHARSNVQSPSAPPSASPARPSASPACCATSEIDEADLENPVALEPSWVSATDTRIHGWQWGSNLWPGEGVRYQVLWPSKHRLGPVHAQSSDAKQHVESLVCLQAQSKQGLLEGKSKCKLFPF